MADRIVNGNTHTENGWRLVDGSSCVWVKVPGTNPRVTLLIREGQPVSIMGAFAADYNAWLEKLRDADSSCYTESNSVLGQPGKNNGSNHMSGTAMDLNWDGPDGKTFRLGISKEQAYPGIKSQVLDELISFYEGMIFCGGNWSIRDWMHFQMGYNTYGSQNVEKVNDFIRRKIRPDGFSTFRRENVPGIPPVQPPAQLSRAERYALDIINEGKRLGITPRGIIIALAVALVETNLTMYANSNDPASLDFPHDAVGHDHMSSGLFQQQPPWGLLGDRMNPTMSARIFFMVDHGPGVRGLTKIPYDYNSTDHTMGFYAQKVQGSAFPDRYDKRMGEATTLYNKLANTPGPEEGFLMALSDQEQRALYNAVMNGRPSRSPLRDPGDINGPDQSELLVGDAPDQIWDVDGSVHIMVVYLLASVGHPGQLALLRRVAAMKDNPGKYPRRQGDAELANNLLAFLGAPRADVEVAPPLPLRQTRPDLVAYDPVSPPPAETYVMPTLRAIEAAVEALPTQNTHVETVNSSMPEDLLDILQRMDVFNREYRKRFDQLTKQSEEENG